MRSHELADLLAEGDVLTASKLLRQPFRVRGRIIKGTGRGRRLGIPTATMEVIDQLFPMHGVYCVRVELPDARWLPGVCHIGPREAWNELDAKMSFHLFDFDEDLYGLTVQVDFILLLRRHLALTDPSEVVGAIKADIEIAKRRQGEDQTRGDCK